MKLAIGGLTNIPARENPRGRGKNIKHRCARRRAAHPLKLRTRKNHSQRTEYIPGRKEKNERWADIYSAAALNQSQIWVRGAPLIVHYVAVPTIREEVENNNCRAFLQDT